MSSSYQKQLPGAHTRPEQESPYTPPGPKPLVMEQFQGMDQSGNRASVEDKQMWWCDGWIPLNERHLRTMWGVGDSIYTSVLPASGNDTYTKVLLHLDGTDASTTITDSNVGGSAHVWTANGNAQIDTAQYEFGGASGLFDGTGDFVSTPDSSDFTLGSGNFTFDCWFNCNAAGGTSRALVGQSDDAFTTASSWIIRRETTNVFALYVRAISAGAFLTGTTQFTDVLNTGWHHLALVRNGNTWTIYINGILEVSSTNSATVADSALNLFVGIRSPTQDAWLGWIDEVRLSVGIARWTANFVPPTAAYAAVSGSNTVFFDFANIATMPLAIVFLADGSVIQVNTLTGVATTIAVAGTITDPARANCDISQWGNQYAILVSNQANGYFLWDGMLLYSAGTLAPNITMQYVGSGYTSAPTVTAYGGSGSGVTLAAIESGGVITGVSIVSLGSGYGASEAVGLAFSGGGTTVSTAIITPTVSGGAITGTAITNAGNGYVQTNIVASIVGGGGSGASLSLKVTSGTVSSVTLVGGGSGYLTTPTVIVTDPNNTVARATATLMPFGVQGNTVETYQGHVWVANQAVYYWSSPGNPGDFSSSLGGGNATNTDSNLKVGFRKLRASNGFLYMIADSSIKYISGVQTSGIPAVTTFTIQDADPESGSSWPGSVITYGRSIFYANSFGVHSLAGANSEKFSIDIDNLYDSVPDFAGFQLSSAKATIFNRKCYMVLCPVINPYTQEQENKLLLWNNKRWFASGQDVDLTYVQTQEIDSELTAWGTDGLSLYPLFQEPSNQFTKVVQSKLWDMPGGYEYGKTATRFWMLGTFEGSSTVTLGLTIDSERTSAAYTLTSPTDIIPVVNASSVTIPTVNASSVTINVVSVRDGFFITDPLAVGQQGMLQGMTLSTAEEDMVLISAKLQPEIVQYRG